MKLVILDPGHFHAALVQKKMYDGIEPVVDVYAPKGPDLDDYLRRIAQFNGRDAEPTHWETRLHTGEDYLERFAAHQGGGVAVIAGNNRRKSEYLARAVAAGFDVLGDKPMAIDSAGFAALERTFARAREKGVMLYDIMTERHEVTSMLQKAFSRITPLFGQLLSGTPADPAVTKVSVHHFSKLIAGAPIVRPAWFFDTAQQGEGLVDITTHLVDLVQWSCFPEEILDFRRDVEIVSAKRWPTVLSRTEFEQVTRLDEFPAFLRKDVQPDGILRVYANGEIRYRLRGINVRVEVRWDFAAPPGAGDSHYSVMRGSGARLVIRQGEAQGHQPTLYLEPGANEVNTDFAERVEQAVAQVAEAFPGVGAVAEGSIWRVTIPAHYHVGHEAHFGQVADEFLRYRAEGNLPAWEVPNTLAKYHTTTQALAFALAGN